MSEPSRRSALLITMFFPPEFGGGATGAWNRALILQRLGFMVFILTGFPSYPSGKVVDKKYKGKVFCIEHVESLTIIRFRLLPIAHDGITKRFLIFANFIVGTLIFMPKVISLTGQLSLVYARSPILLSFIPGYIYSEFSRSFFILEMPDLWPEELVTVKSRFSRILMTAGEWVADVAYSTPDLIITVSSLAAKYITEKYRPPVRVYGIPVGVDQSTFLRLSKEKARELLIQEKVFPEEFDSKFIVLYSGLISEAQKVDSLLRAAAKLDDPGISIVIIGEGPDKAKLIQLKSELKLGSVYFLPRQPRELMPAVISACDVCTVMLSPESIFEIALPTKFYEYLACCKPLIGVCKGELAQIITTNKIGYVAESGDDVGITSAIRELKHSPALMNKMEENCANTLALFTIEHIASQLSQIGSKYGLISYA